MQQIAVPFAREHHGLRVVHTSVDLQHRPRPPEGLGSSPTTVVPQDVQVRARVLASLLLRQKSRPPAPLALRAARLLLLRLWLWLWLRFCSNGRAAAERAVVGGGAERVDQELRLRLGRDGFGGGGLLSTKTQLRAVVRGENGVERDALHVIQAGGQHGQLGFSAFLTDVRALRHSIPQDPANTVLKVSSVLQELRRSLQLCVRTAELQDLLHSVVESSRPHGPVERVSGDRTLTFRGFVHPEWILQVFKPFAKRQHALLVHLFLFLWWLLFLPLKLLFFLPFPFILPLLLFHLLLRFLLVLLFIFLVLVLLLLVRLLFPLLLLDILGCFSLLFIGVIPPVDQLCGHQQQLGPA
eukprot:RCo012007